MADQSLNIRVRLGEMGESVVEKALIAVFLRASTKPPPGWITGSTTFHMRSVNEEISPHQSPEQSTHVQQAGRTASEAFNGQIAQSSRQSPRPTLSCAAQSVELPRRARIGSGLVCRSFHP